ncbi:MAG: GTPase ObgE, partial [Phycisphaerae bacterium]|nr:GTPase ObgE [Phycisphaerae bacterium]
MFIDEADIYVKAGNGGTGCISFRREAHVPKGGPDGGDGGRGGKVIFHADPHMNTLSQFRGRHHWRAENGQPGRGKSQSGRGGKDLLSAVPCGTLIYDKEHGNLLADLVEPGQSVVIARCGAGGRGNAAFATATNQAPREFEPGKPGEERELHLELKLIADVGLVGLPNAGKSTLLARLSAARPKIASYPFTTLEPQLGIVEADTDNRFVVADIPGLIEGSHRGVGLGDEFLRHIERTRIILHLVEPDPASGQSLAEAYHAIREELRLYSKLLAEKPEIVAISKSELLGDDEQEAIDELAGE